MPGMRCVDRLLEEEPFNNASANTCCTSCFPFGQGASNLLNLRRPEVVCTVVLRRMVWGVGPHHLKPSSCEQARKTPRRCWSWFHDAKGKKETRLGFPSEAVLAAEDLGMRSFELGKRLVRDWLRI